MQMRNADNVPATGPYRNDAGVLDPLGRHSFELPKPSVRPIENYLPFGRPNFSSEEIEAVTRVLHSGWIGMGAETLAFEEELAASIGVPHVVTVNSCTSALFLSLLLHGVGEGDEVICPSLTWCATANAALYLGATPVFCDVDPQTLSVTPETILKKVTVRTRAVRRHLLRRNPRRSENLERGTVGRLDHRQPQVDD